MKKVTLFTFIAFSLTFANESAYTSIANKDCKTKEVFEHNMGASLSCGKFEQFETEIIDEDARMSITIKRQGIEYPQRYSSSVGAGFSSLGSKIEWRYAKDASFDPHAFIARVNFSIENEQAPNGHKEVSKLAVSKIDKHSICVVGVIPPVKNQNVLARELSDKARNMPCLIEAQNHREASIKKVLANNAQLEASASSEKAFNYARDMGPLEHALRVLKTPSFPVWRMRLRLYPIFSRKFPSQLGGYRVVTNHINLSYTLHDTMIEQYGVKNVDPSLKNTDPTVTYSLAYMIMRTPAAFIEEDINPQYDVYLEEEACGLQKSCTQLYEEDKGNWSKGTDNSLTKAPWESYINTLPSMLRALTKKAGWLTNDRWSPSEIPEGMNKDTPWVEVIIENHVGNGGSYLMEWYDLVSDDSIAKTLYSIDYDEASQKAQVNIQSAVLCGRGKNTNKPTQMCQ